ncbi:undecaprenyldiphospho-muramoylpentapeptide beta-N-acetylglucosaminyltransferase [Aestuariibacter salexigens]|uniref:undecaprenyldiphospho-muramoylpentapeptide beta-N-acetylglucosaminyltransferase n=1 Tax=Aestuariibacter salexigens TaxID=226010 RepID=UPI0003F79072|nr:undecaprenyldiphospho-muramoylpentapeptide beta-N-acetylglucosaminyltransferase [Aestuariibacter salexigens]
MSHRILIMAGGTGGHVFPGLAVAQVLHQKGWSVHWLGTAQRMEAQLVPNAGYEISFVDVVGVRRNGLLNMLKAPFQVIRAVWQARKVLKQYRPDIVLGMGGFASGPGGVAAWLAGTPLIIHEQNAIAGMTNRILAFLSARVLAGFEGAFAQHRSARVRGKVQVMGNPVRDVIEKLPASDAPHTPLRLLIIGGSLGAKILNYTLPGVIARLADIEVRHQCGKDNSQAVSAAYQQYVGQRNVWHAVDFVDDMASAYQWADLIICRAGALTVAELAVAGKAAIYVPLPHAVDDHQTFNARSLSDAGAGILMPQHEMNEDKLVEVIQALQAAPQKIVAMSQQARRLGKRGVADNIASLCEQLVGEAA